MMIKVSESPGRAIIFKYSFYLTTLMTEPGTIRIKTNLKTYEKTKRSWKLSKQSFPAAKHVIELFIAHNNFEHLVDKKDPKFLKGQIYNNKLQGARINILPDGTKLDKAYSLFAKNLTLHDQSSNSHWDVLYQNPGGTYSYVYTLEKKHLAKKNKYKKVKEFEKHYPTIKRKVTCALKNKNDNLALPMYTLLKTYMRVGNEIYYKKNKHKGLTTLKKKDIKISGNLVTFNYLGKDGIPQNIQEKFPKSYISRLKQTLKPLKNTSFVFTENGHPIPDIKFKQAFKKYCGKEFYPHIVRSYYATQQAKQFLKNNKSPTKKEIKLAFEEIAKKLGHKRFVKNEWKDSYTVTMNHYIDPIIVEKIKSLSF